MIKVVVTRPVVDARYTIKLIRQIGFSAIPFPLLKLTALSDVIFNRSMNDYNWILFTSSNAVRFFIEFCGNKKISLNDQNKIAAVGPATAKTLHSFGFNADFIPGIFNRTAISEQIPVEKGDIILYPALKDEPARVENTLMQRGCTVDRLDVYQSDPVIYQKEKWSELAMSRPDVITFFSPRTVRAYFENRQESINLKEYVIAVLAESSADELAKFGYSAHIKTEIPTAENLLQKIKDYYA